ncbi:MAG: hypothetical protein ACXWZF_14255 [Actinomycetota bacterium]
MEWDPQPPGAAGPGYVIAGGENAAGPGPSRFAPPKVAIDLRVTGGGGDGVALTVVRVPDRMPIEQAGGDPTFGAVSK